MKDKNKILCEIVVNSIIFVVMLIFSFYLIYKKEYLASMITFNYSILVFIDIVIGLGKIGKNRIKK
ncbi:hypothetical protein ACER0A_005070 [Haloimpatiens sp. FM7315]|uniref:hypothetical protein n=1 Tax=Haloimpatiens sp. FM7315 TaxID=3298609 RepID=UPI0035A27808